MQPNISSGAGSVRRRMRRYKWISRNSVLLHHQNAQLRTRSRFGLELRLSCLPIR
jgi:hypothetical protein